jgi:hypothetical protein
MTIKRVVDLGLLVLTAEALWYGTAMVLAYRFSSTYWACWMVGQ